MSRKQIQRGIARESGFTLVELMISIVISAMVFGAIYTAFRSQQKSTDTQIQIAQMQQNLRAASLLMTRELRMTGFDPSGDAGATVTSALPNALRVTMDLRGDDPPAGVDADGDGITDPDGDLTDPGEDVTYSLYVDADGTQKLGRAAPALNRPVAENIEVLEFFYTMADGSETLNVLPADYGDIRGVKITIIARSERGDPAINNANQSLTLGSGNPWPIPNDNFRRRLMTTSIQFRNMTYK